MTIIRQLFTVVIESVAIAALADFLAGVIHWIEDAYFTEDTPVIGPLFIRPNIVHHHLPRFFTKLSWWESSKDLFLAGLILVAGAAWFHVLTWQVWLFVGLSVNANQIHKWSHRTRAENGRIVSALQDWRILQTPRHHGLHHTDPKNTYYCPMTNLLNPVLERLSFWSHLEHFVERCTGLKHRPDTAVRGQGPGPEWLAEFRPARSVPAAVVKFPEQRSCANDCSRCPTQCGKKAIDRPRAA